MSFDGRRTPPNLRIRHPVPIGDDITFNHTFSDLEMVVLVDRLAEQENLDGDIVQRLKKAFSVQGEIGYRLRVIPDDNICNVYINEVWIINLKGLERDPHEIGRNFLAIINRQLFDNDLVHIGYEDVVEK